MRSLRFFLFLLIMGMGPGQVLAMDRSPASLDAALLTALSDLDRARIQTGLLYDRVIPLSGIDHYSGSASALPVNLRQWKQMYDEMYRASLDPPTWPDIKTLVSSADESIVQGVIPIAMMSFRYNRIRPDALEDGSMRIHGERLVEGEGNPYAEKRVFSAVALKDYTHRGERVVFRFDRRLYVSGTSEMPDRIEVDFDDGSGFQTVRFDRDRVVSYQAPGKKTIRLRASFPDRATQHASFRFDVANLVTPTPDDTLMITASIAHNAEFGTGEAYVYLADNHVSLARPIIVIEGFDLDDTMNWDELYDLLNKENLIETARANGFDAVVLNFTQATDYIQKNSFVVTELINQVNAMVPAGTPLTLVGASMGGLCSRYALAYMETNAISHNIDTFISFDAPHKGANIPLGIQYWLDFFSGQSTEAAFLLSRLDTPAARQMLVYHHTTPPGVTGEPDPLRAVLETDFSNVGDYPSEPRLVAMANGSGFMANQGFAAGDQIVEWEHSSFFVNITGNVWAVGDNTSQMIFDGLISIILVINDSQVVTVNSTSPYDNAPGGSRSSMADMDSVVAPYGDIVALHPSHCFIPTTSALDLSTTDLFYDIDGDANLLQKTPFDVVYYPMNNEGHVDITPEIAGWLLGELNLTVTAIPDASLPTIVGIALHQNFPNPFNPSTSITFELDQRTVVDLRVFDVEGREVTALAKGELAAGPHTVDWNGRDGAGQPVASGIYFYRLSSGTTVLTRRMALLK